MNARSLIALLGLVAFASGCASTTEYNPKTCALIGGLVGAGGGAVAANANHTKDNDQQMAVGAAVGAGLGSIAGYVLCNPPTSRMPPTAKISATPMQGQAPLDVAFRGVGEDTDGRVVAYKWDFGDGAGSSEQHPSHSYPRDGRYVAMLTVTDNDNLTGSANVPIQVSEAQVERAVPTVAKRIVLRGVNFDFDSATVRSDAEVILVTAAEVLSENPEVKVQVAGHTDSTGPDDYNTGLSERRARAVADYLSSNGIGASRVSVVGYGESQPVADNGTRDGRAQNRRVELNVLQ